MIQLHFKKEVGVSDDQLSAMGNRMKKLQSDKVARRDAFWKRSPAPAAPAANVPQKLSAPQYTTERGDIVTLSKGLWHGSIVTIGGKTCPPGVVQIKNGLNWFTIEVKANGVASSISTGKVEMKPPAAKATPQPAKPQPAPTENKPKPNTQQYSKVRFAAKSTTKSDTVLIGRLKNIYIKAGEFLKAAGVDLSK